MGVNKSITIEGVTFQFEDKPRGNSPFTDQELKF